MSAVTLSVVTDDSQLNGEAIIELYNSVGWTAYTDHPEALLRGLRDSLRVVLAYRGGVLVGLARVIGDGATICYLQDVLVHPAAQRLGVGRALVREAFEPYVDVRQHVLITDEQPEQKAFYGALGFTHFGADTPGRAFVRFQ